MRIIICMLSAVVLFTSCSSYNVLSRDEEQLLIQKIPTLEDHELLALYEKYCYEVSKIEMEDYTNDCSSNSTTVNNYYYDDDGISTGAVIGIAAVAVIGLLIWSAAEDLKDNYLEQARRIKSRLYLEIVRRNIPHTGWY